MWFGVRRPSRGKMLPCGSVRIAGRSEGWSSFKHKYTRNLVGVGAGKTSRNGTGDVRSKTGYLPCKTTLYVTYCVSSQTQCLIPSRS